LIVVNQLIINESNTTNTLHNGASWLANELSRTGIGMKAKKMVSTGTLSGMHVVNTAQQDIADFGPFGQVDVTFEP
jgi:2-keto-4-pentenoate hydratase